MTKNLKYIAAAFALTLSMAPVLAFTQHTHTTTPSVAAVNDTYDFPGQDASTSYISKPAAGYLLQNLGPAGAVATGVNIPTISGNSGTGVTGAGLNVPGFTTLSMYYTAAVNANDYLGGYVQDSNGYYYGIQDDGHSTNIGGDNYFYAVKANELGLTSGASTIVQAAFVFTGGTGAPVSSIEVYKFSVNGTTALSKFIYALHTDSEFNFEYTSGSSDS